MPEQTRETGTIRRVIAERGFFFIAPDNGCADVFGHVADLRPVDHRPRLARGMRVAYATVRGSQGPDSRAAVEIEVMGGEP